MDSGTVLHCPTECSGARFRWGDTWGDAPRNSPSKTTGGIRMDTHGKRRYNVLSAAFVGKATESGHYWDGHGL